MCESIIFFESSQVKSRSRRLLLVGGVAGEQDILRNAFSQ